ncbi:MAG: thioredoxin 1 [Candidatus Saganbacteria bacterium]|uniref:Thioredoxin n=1 Tax=Candidatus Saganbacteria bacterium TaxID=2575572 RepID=A0A833NRD1_UNCSA|nr:MAG: thioredoxin 1 [Candidatus Saganbacteria bacterium]
MAKEISDNDFLMEVENFKGIAFVDFWAPWCGPCKMMAPVFDKMSQKYNSIKFVKVNTTENMKKASEYGVSSIPCIIIFKDGKEADRIVGFQDENSFEQIVKKYSSA